MKMKIIICWLYPDLMSTYGDRGNIIIFQKRLQWRGIEVKVLYHTTSSSYKDIQRADILFMGGAQDYEQALVLKDLKGKKGKLLVKSIEDNVPGLYICGAYQFLGDYYKLPNGKKLYGLGVFNMYTESKKNTTRCIGNCVVRWKKRKLVGFENHGGRTYLGENLKPFAYVIKGYGNNGYDKTEGAWYKNSIGTYMHGPILSKNPDLADFIIKEAIFRKYGDVKLLSLLNKEEENARRYVLQNRI